jgi:hypothetical protein
MSVITNGYGYFLYFFLLSHKFVGQHKVQYKIPFIFYVIRYLCSGQIENILANFLAKDAYSNKNTLKVFSKKIGKCNIRFK